MFNKNAVFEHCLLLPVFTMEGITFKVFVVLLCGIQFSTVQCLKCEIETKYLGRIFANSKDFATSTRCWTIVVPSSHFVELKLMTLETSGSCGDAYVNISIPEKSEAHKFCNTDNYKTTITSFGNVTVTHHAPFSRNPSILELEYNVTNICRIQRSFRCNNNLCILEKNVCNGIKDCINGEDETGCPGILDITGIDEARENANFWLKSRKDHLKSQELARAVVALFLGSSASFNGTDLEEELMATRMELKTAAALLNSSVSSTDLSMFINALLVTCHNPRKFYEQDLVNKLKEQVEKTEDFVHPSAYLTLCNANETWPETAELHLNRILDSQIEYPFLRDFQAITVMALSCKIHLDETPDSMSSYNITSYNDVIKKFKESQLPNGSFGNVHTTALITQALIASDEMLKLDWNWNATFEFLMKNTNSSSTDFLTTYYTLPLFNGKTLTDISNNNCSANPRKQGYEIETDTIPKVTVRYSLYIGDEKDVIHTMYLRVPQNSTFYEVMKSAAAQNPDYRFEAITLDGKMHLYRIGKFTNDPDMGKYWLLHFEYGSIIPVSTKSPDKLYMRMDVHFIYWYKTASL